MRINYVRYVVYYLRFTNNGRSTKIIALIGSCPRKNTLGLCRKNAAFSSNQPAHTWSRSTNPTYIRFSVKSCYIFLRLYRWPNTDSRTLCPHFRRGYQRVYFFKYQN